MIADIHEPPQIVTLLKQRGIDVEVRAITPGDYVVGDMGIERKSMPDFFSSLVRKRLFEQLKRLKIYPLSLLIVEGDLHEISRHKTPASLWGALVAIMMDLGIHVIFSSSKEQTVEILSVLEKRIRKEKKETPLRFKPKVLSLREKQKFIAQGLPHIGEKISEEMLEHFGTVRAVFSSSEKELKKVEGIGERTAREIRELLDAPFEGKQEHLK